MKPKKRKELEKFSSDFYKKQPDSFNEIINSMKEDFISCKIVSMGMPLVKWTHKSCTAHVAVGEIDNEIGTDSWATVYSIYSEEKGQGHATQLLTHLKKLYEGEGRKFGSSVALNDNMERLLKKLGITEYQ